LYSSNVAVAEQENNKSLSSDNMIVRLLWLPNPSSMNPAALAESGIEKITVVVLPYKLKDAVERLYQFRSRVSCWRG